MGARLPFLRRRAGLTSLLGMPGLEALYDAQIPSSVNPDSVGRVAQWNDLTGKARHLTQATAGSQPIYLPWSGGNYGYCPGVAGNYFGTPDSAAVSVTGDIDIRADITAENWAPATVHTIVGKWTETTNQRSFLFDIDTGGPLRFVFSSGGTTPTGIHSSTAGTGFAANSRRWIRVTRSASSGSITFYTSTDGSNWVQLGATISGTISPIFDGTAAVELGCAISGTVQNFPGKIHYAEIRNGIGGTVVAAFDPSRATDGASSFVASTGETWTVNTSGGKPAQIVGRASVLFDGVDDWLKTAAFTLNQPETVYFVGKQVTWTLDEIIYDGDNIASSGRMVLYQTTASPGMSLFAGTVLPVSAPAVGVAAVVASVFNGAASLSAVNRGLPTTGNAGANNAGGFTLGVEASTTGRWSNIQVSAVAIFSAAHDARTRARVINYLLSRYNIAASP